MHARLILIPAMAAVALLNATPMALAQNVSGNPTKTAADCRPAAAILGTPLAFPSLPAGAGAAVPHAFSSAAPLPPAASPDPSVSKSPPPLAAPSSSASPCPVDPVGGLQAAIYAAAMAYNGTSTCGLHGASGDEACMASVNQVLMNAGIPPIGPPPYGTNYIPTAVLQYGNRLQPIPQSDTVPGDLMVRHSAGETYTSAGGDEHITVCVVRGCTQTLSNHSSTCNFSWFSDDTLCYAGSPYCNGYSNFYRVLP